MLEQKRGGSRDRWYAQNWIPTSNAMPSPVSARRLVSEVNTADMLEIQAPTWHVKAETASAVHQRIRGVLGWVIAMNLRNDNSCDRVLRCSVRRTTSAERHRDAPAGPAPQGRGRGHRDGTRVGLRTGRIKAAFEILVLTAVRPGEARGARWEEIDFGEAAWTIPAARMKATREHRVPLSARAIEVLHATERLRTGSTPAQSAGLVFPSAPGKQLADARLSKLLEQLGVGAVPHGFRSSFRDWASERTNHLRPVVEAALAHTVRGQTVACCDHAFGNSTPCCSNSASPAALVMRALRFSHSISSNGSFPPWSCASRRPVPDSYRWLFSSCFGL